MLYKKSKENGELEFFNVPPQELEQYQTQNQNGLLDGQQQVAAPKQLTPEEISKMPFDELFRLQALPQ